MISFYNLDICYLGPVCKELSLLAAPLDFALASARACTSIVSCAPTKACSQAMLFTCNTRKYNSYLQAPCNFHFYYIGKSHTLFMSKTAKQPYPLGVDMPGHNPPLGGGGDTQHPLVEKILVGKHFKQCVYHESFTSLG